MTHVQSDSESSSSDDDILNSATEISTDSEFDHDPIIREAPKIFIDDTHLRKPTRVQIKQAIIGNGIPGTQPKLRTVTNTQATTTALQTALTYQQLEFKPLVQVDPSLLNSNRIPLKNPRPGDYLLNKTASTEGIASKTSLELKKRYLLGGEHILGNKIMKSGSTSILDSKLKNFHSNISECQKLLNPAADISPGMKTFLDRTKLSSSEKSGAESGDKDSSIKTVESKENIIYINNKNEQNKDVQYLETLNTTLIENLTNASKTQNSENVITKNIEKNLPNNLNLTKNSTKSIILPVQIPSPIIETIDLISPEKTVPIIDLTEIDIPSSMVKSNQKFIDNIKIENNSDQINQTAIEVIDLIKTEESILSPDISKDAKQTIPDIITHIDDAKVIMEIDSTKQISTGNDNDCQETSIQVPNIPWKKKLNKHECENLETDSLSTASSTSSLDDIPHYILDSTTSPDTQNGFNMGSNGSAGEQIVPRLEIHDSSGALMQIDSLMIIDGQYIGDPEDLKLMEIPEGMNTSSSTITAETVVENVQNSVTNDSGNEKLKQKPNDDTSTNRRNTSESSASSNSRSNKKVELKFDTKNENKVESLKNLPLLLENNKKENDKPVKPKTLEFEMPKSISSPHSTDNDKTPTAGDVVITPLAEQTISDSETEMTGQVLTETELSDWAADDAVSENFVDIEFVLNSNKGTIKRNKKANKKKSSNNIGTAGNSSNTKSKQLNKLPTLATAETPTKECGGILENLAIGEIDFMDTGSEGSCAEAYAATNQVLIRNRGYIEFIENNAITPTSSSPYHQTNINTNSSNNYQQKDNNYATRYKRSNSNKEILGVDYIEQGACILGSRQQEIDLKTPVNEIPPPIFTTGKPLQQMQSADSTNELDDDSLAMITSQGATNTTTEESDALTVVTSPLDSSSPRTQDNLGELTSTASTSSPAVDNKNKIIGSNLNSNNKSNSIGNAACRRRSSQEDLLNSIKRKDSDEMSYEEYVRKLQQKITQISHARDSIDVRKHKRKTSRGESIGSVGDLVLNENRDILSDQKALNIIEPLIAIQKINPISSSSIVTAIEDQPLYNKVPEIPTLSSKLEEITKERTKQKDLIHDLVMDKLQSKKQLNAEKRLNRSRNRSLFSSNNNSSGIAGSGFLSSTPKSSSTSNGTSNQYHISDVNNISCKENIPTSTKSINLLKNPSPKDNKDIIQLFGQASSPRKQRPLSDNLDKATLGFQAQNILSNKISLVSKKKSEESLQYCATTPIAPPRTRKLDETPLTEKLRADARARARLKTNQDLGISPEEKLQMLRKRYHLDLQEVITNSQNANKIQHTTTADELKARQRKMTTSKSVNDISHHSTHLLSSDENFNTTKSTPSGQLILDFTSDPNLSNSVNCNKDCTNKLSSKLSRRQKDPERRKSLIQTVSSFFNKSGNKKDKESPISPPKDSKEKQSQNSFDQQSSHHQSSVFSRFRISPKSKDKSKDKDELQLQDQSNLAQETYKKFEYSSSPQLFNKDNLDDTEAENELNAPPPIPPLPLNYQRSDDESCTNESREQKKQRAISKASRQAELKRIRIAQEIQREQEEIEVQLKEYEARGVLIEKALRGEGQNIENLETTSMGASDEKLLKELLEIWRNITQLKKRDEELGIRQQELKLEHRHAQLKEELNMRLSYSKLDKSSADVAAEGAILNEMLEIVAKRAALRPNENSSSSSSSVIGNVVASTTNRQSTSNDKNSEI